MLLHRNYQHSNHHGKTVACKAIAYICRIGLSVGSLLINKKIIHLEAESSKKLVFPTTLLFKEALSKFSFDRKTGIRKLFSSICILTKKRGKIVPTILCFIKILFKSIQKIKHVVTGLHAYLCIPKDLQRVVKIIVAKSQSHPAHPSPFC